MRIRVLVLELYSTSRLRLFSHICAGIWCVIALGFVEYRQFIWDNRGWPALRCRQVADFHSGSPARLSIIVEKYSPVRAPISNGQPVADRSRDMSRRPRVALDVETSLVYGRRILEGVSRYLRANRPWSIYLEQHELGSDLPGLLRRCTEVMGM